MDREGLFYVGGIIIVMGAMLVYSLIDSSPRIAFCESKGLEGGFAENEGIRCLGEEKKYCVNGSNICHTKRENIIFPYKELQEIEK